MQQPQPETLTLQRLTAKLARKIGRLISIIGIFMVLTTLPMIYSILSAKYPHAGNLELIQLGMQALVHHLDIFFSVVILTVLFVLFPFIAPKLIRAEKIVLDSQGIRYETPVRGIFSMSSSWSLRWAEIKSVSLSRALANGVLFIKPQHGGQKSLLVTNWRSPEELAVLEKLPVWKLIYEIQNKRNGSEAVRNSALVRYFRKLGYLDESRQKNTELNFDLAKNPASVFAMTLMFIFIAYGFADLVANDEIYIQKPPMDWFVSGGIVLAIIMVGVLLRKKVPKGNAIGLAVMVGGAFGFAMYPGLLRINQFTDKTGLQAVHYRHVTDYSFTAQQPGTPLIKVEPDKYWQSVPSDADVTFMLRRGALNFYQLDMAPVYGQMRHWYCRQRAAKKGSDPKKCDDIK